MDVRVDEHGACLPAPVQGCKDPQCGHWGSLDRLLSRALPSPAFVGVGRKTRFGHCRGTEPADYVRDIDERYTAYVQLLPASKPADAET